MRFTEIISESLGTRLKDIAKIATNMPDADFWLVRKGSDKTVGKPVKEFDPSRIGVKVVRTDVLDPKYLYYVMMNLHNQGHFARIANGTTNLVNIRVEDIANIPFGQQDVAEESKGLWANIHAKQNRIKHGSGEKMRKPGSKGAPSAQNFKDAANEAANPAQQAAIAIAKKKEQGIDEDWNKVNKKDKTSGMSQKAVNAYRRENPGSKLKTAVTTKPSKLKPGSKDAKRRKSFCARMSGNKGPMKKPNGKPTPKALALRRWNCESIEQLEELVMLAEQKIRDLKK